MLRGGPPMVRGGPPMGRGVPPMGRGGPPLGRGGPPRGRGGPPPFGRGGPHSLERGEPMDRHWEEPESVEYSEEGDPNWGESLPPVRGMRPPFPPGRGRPPRGHPGFMQQGPGRPPHLPHGPMDHESMGHEFDTENAERESMFYGHDSHSHSMHSEVGRGRRRVPPPHEIMDPMEEPVYDEALEGEMSWPHVRGRPIAPHEMMDMGGVRRRPMGRGMARGMWRPGPTHQAYEESHNEGYVLDYGHGEDGPRWRPHQDYPPEDYRDENKYSESEWDRGRAPPERDLHRDGPWQDELKRGHTYPYDEHNRGKGELRIREYREEPPYPQPSNFDRSRLPPPPAERGYSADYDDRRGRYEEPRAEPPLNRPLPSSPHVPKLPETSDSAAQGPSGPNVLALSQHQHEIILKAAQELKLIRLVVNFH